ncbi:hypothetical protein KIN20_026539 [Parelaphostrongylus tenuis]|uniref:mitogen-activated protein kinase kinase n=1 Tax=Parelaphostrongylus tenuis TaxID=148309 RepID=A0AAD5QY78_PARTN|nr:hypothetical protein KIN20_026539 [Parelaphostrongylus tenuis]
MKTTARQDGWRRGGTGVDAEMPGVPITNFMDEFTRNTDDDKKLEEVLKHLSIDILSALSYLHARNIVHLDVNPLNLLVSTNRVHLVDFGSARFLDDDDLQWGDGDIRYSAPERLDGNLPTSGSDIWSYGAVLFQLCFGVTPHRLLTTTTTMSEMTVTATTTKRRTTRSMPGTTNAQRRSSALIAFLSEVLASEASRRPSADVCLERRWFQ